MAILDGAHQVAVPALAATLTICIVFFPVVMLERPARFLFVPLALSVVFSMLASYLLSRTLVPSAGAQAHAAASITARERRRWARFNRWRDRKLRAAAEIATAALLSRAPRSIDAWC